LIPTDCTALIFEIMEALKKVLYVKCLDTLTVLNWLILLDSSPGHSVDDELMYGTEPAGKTKPTTENPGKVAGHGSDSTTPLTEGGTTHTPGTATSGLASSAQSQAKDDASTASIRSGVLGTSPGESKLTSETANTTSGVEPSKDSVPDPQSAQSRDFAARADPQADSNYTRERDEKSAPINQTSTSSSYTPGAANITSRGVDREYNDPAAYQRQENSAPFNQTSTYSSNPRPMDDSTSRTVDHQYKDPGPQADPYSTRSSDEDRAPIGQADKYHSYVPTAGHSTSRPVDRKYNNPTTYQQPDTMNTGRELSVGSGAAGAAVGDAGAGDRDQNANAPEQDFSGASGMATGGGSHFGSRKGMPGEYPRGESDNPYASTHLDPRVDPHANPSTGGNASTTGAAVTPSIDPVGRSGEYESSKDNRGLSGTKTTAEPFDGPKGTSERLGGQGQHDTGTGATIGAVGLGGYALNTKGHDPVPQSDVTHSGVDSSTPAASGTKPTHAPDTGARTSDTTTHEDDSHKHRKGGILGALGLKGHGAKKHAEEKPERPTAGSRRESIPTTAYPPGTTLGDERYPTGPVGGSTATPSGAQVGKVAPSTRNFSQPSTTPDATYTQPSTGHGATTGPTTATPVSTAKDQPEESHLGRNAAIGGAAAAGAGAIGGHEYSKHQAEKEEQERLENDRAHQKAVEESRKAAEKEQKAHDKAIFKEEKKAEKEHEKAVHKEEKEYEKAVKKEEKKAEKEHEKAVKKEEKAAEKDHEKALKREEKEHHKAILAEEKKEKEYEKEIARQEKEHEKEIAGQEKEHEKEIAKQEKELEKRRNSQDKEKKHGGLLGLFKRRRDSKGNEVEDEEHDHTGSKTAAGIGAAGAAGVGAHEAKKHHEINKLHKDPPPGLGYSGDPATPAYADYAVMEKDHPGAQTVAGGHTAPAPEHDMHKMRKGAPPGVGQRDDSATPAYADYPAQDTDLHRAQNNTSGYNPPAPEHDGKRYAEAAGNGSMVNRPRGVYDTSTSPGVYGDVSSKGYESQATGGTSTTAQARDDAGPTEARVNEVMGGKSNTTSADGNRGMPTSDYASHVARTTDHTGPTSGYASQVTGGTGTTALAQGHQGFDGSHIEGGSGVAASPRDNRATAQESGQGVSAGNHPAAQTGLKIGDLKYGDPPTEGYASQVTGGTGTSALAQDEKSGKISVHSDGRRHYADGSLVDPVEESGNVRRRSDGSKIEKVLEKLHLRKGSRGSVGAAEPGSGGI
jgi:hypothetical protein